MNTGFTQPNSSTQAKADSDSNPRSLSDHTSPCVNGHNVNAEVDQSHTGGWCERSVDQTETGVGESEANIGNGG